MVTSPLTLRGVLAELERSVPLRLAEPWDNVGLLIEPHESDAPCTRALLTVDFTEVVLAEALSWGAELVIAYHPPVFGGLKRLRATSSAERVVVTALRRGLTVYSPHTALDAVPGGMTDWLAEALGPGTKRVILPASSDGPELSGAGQGRVVTLTEPVTLSEAVARIKAHLGLSHLRVAAADTHEQGALVRTLAVCPGAGGKVFERVDEVDLLLTGEMRHHDVLGRRAAGTSVVLCDHTNSERGFLPVWAARLAASLPGVELRVAESDRDPLRVL